MKKLTSYEMRQMWFDFWESKDHEIIESASLLPKNDPTLLWIGAGVAALKKYFDGSEIPNNRRMAGSQKSIRTTDIDNVGRTARHHTFFEMLGNFSIGDYFKKEAIEWGLEFLTSEEWINFDINKLYMTIYPTDIEAKELWISLGVKESNIIPIEENFWEIGPGPSGPDSEIFYDRGEQYDPENIGFKLLAEDIENDRYIEIWNIVFSQYNAKEGLDRSEYPELPSKNIDTGMGLERMLSILQGADTNFETDLFMPIINKTEEISGKEYTGQMAFKVIADHVRTCTFALADGANFGNTGRDYVLRRLLRRAVRYSKMLGMEKPFMSELVPVVVKIMEGHYPELKGKMNTVMKKITKEEELFNKTLTSGEKRLDELFESAKDNKISGEDAFKLYDTYGFPFELTLEYAEEKGFKVSKDEFDDSMKKQKELARANRSNKASMNVQNEDLLNFKDGSVFVGYDNLSYKSFIIALFDGHKFVAELENEGYVVLDKTPFYAESGGQVSDSGVIMFGDTVLEVTDSFKGPNGQHFHYVTFDGKITKNEEVDAQVDIEMRNKIMKNHSATHLLQKALREVLGEDVHQAGSKVDEHTLRFDFTYNNKITKADLIKIEDIVNEKISHDKKVITDIMTIEEAKKSGAMALFDEKYGDSVRVLTIYDSKELCGGTHVDNVSDIIKFSLKSLDNKGSGVYRIEGTTASNIETEMKEAAAPYLLELSKLADKVEKIFIESNKENIDLEFEMKVDFDKFTSYKDIAY